MFPDSDFAKQYSCARTKTASIISEMADEHQKSMIKVLHNSTFSLVIDGSNDMDMKFIWLSQHTLMKKVIISKVLSLPNLFGDSTVENIA